MRLLGGTLVRSWVRLGITLDLAFMFSTVFLYSASAGCPPPTLSVLEGGVSMAVFAEAYVTVVESFASAAFGVSGMVVVRTARLFGNTPCESSGRPFKYSVRSPPFCL